MIAAPTGIAPARARIAVAAHLGQGQHLLKTYTSEKSNASGK